MKYYFRRSHPEPLNSGGQLIPGETYEFTEKEVKEDDILSRLLEEDHLLAVHKAKKEGDN